MMTSSSGLRVGIAAHIFASVVMATVYTESTTTSSLGGYTEEALRRLSQVFGIGNVPKLHKRKTAPEYMVELYRSVAFSDGITKRANPYDADVVRGFPDRAPRQQTHYYFNVSFVDKTEDILAGEFRLFKLRPQYSSEDTTRPHRTNNPHTVLLQLYQVLSENWQTTPDGLKLLDQRRIAAHSTGWQVFTVTDTIRQWVNDTLSNHGFLLMASAADGTTVNGTYIRFAQRTEHHDSKQPILVVFSGDMLPRYVLSNRKNKGTALITNPSRNATSAESRPSSKSLESIRNNYIQYLNEEYRTNHGNGFPFDQFKAYMTPSEHERLLAESRQARLVHARRRKTRTRPRRTSERQPRRSEGGQQRRRPRARRTTDYYKPPRRKHKACQRNELYVDFAEIGWAGWIISPKGYNAYHCWGECPFPLGQYYRPTNHATVQSIVHTMRIDKNVHLPCCVPDKLYSISLLYFDDEENVILKQYDEMVAASCGCH